MSASSSAARRRRGSAATASLVAAFASVFAATAMAQPAFSYRNPFHPEQCERAITYAGRRVAVATGGARSRARLILAEGLLCRGLEGDGAALDQAIERFSEIVAREPENFFAQLGLADGLRRRSPHGDATLAAQRRVRQLLAQSDVGAAREELAAYVEENLAAIEQARARLRAGFGEGGPKERGQ
jgi:hypothetical protein